MAASEGEESVVTRARESLQGLIRPHRTLTFSIQVSHSLEQRLDTADTKTFTMTTNPQPIQTNHEELIEAQATIDDLRARFVDMTECLEDQYQMISNDQKWMMRTLAYNLGMTRQAVTELVKDVLDREPDQADRPTDADFPIAMLWQEVKDQHLFLMALAERLAARDQGLDEKEQENLQRYVVAETDRVMDDLRALGRDEELYLSTIAAFLGTT